MTTELSESDNAVWNCIFNPNSPPISENLYTEKLKDEEEPTPEIESSKQLELEAIELAEKGQLNEALDRINNAIKLAPQRPSLYNNRAHIFQYSRQFQEAFKDVTDAISLCGKNHKRTLCLAHCQRGILHKKAKRTELARADFEVAAEMGNTFAKGQLVELNPYAALCNQMLRQVMEKLN